VGLSGGVDSSVAAALLREAGHDVVGVTLRTASWEEPSDPAGRFGSCCSAETAAAARQLARRLAIPYYVLNHEREFAERVITDFTREYGAGRTPSPCVVCNREVKFGTLLGRALAWDAEAVATGHYARVAPDPRTGRLLLLTARDTAKDQSYFLWPLTQTQLARARFPVGGLTKPEVRARAHARGLPTAATPESQELCFVSGDYREFLRARAPEAFRAGPILDERGREIGEHGGLGGYTIGQRRGLGSLGPSATYVVRLDPVRNAVVVGPREALRATRLVASQVNLIALSSLDAPLDVEVRVRHRAPRVPARITPEADGRLGVALREALYAVTPGQSVVWYRGDVVVGGGVIAHAA
jgi:tRNA-specific 2-thiouridylase